jgi:hypothetical protein
VTHGRASTRRRCRAGAESDDARELGGCVGTKGQGSTDKGNCRGAGLAGQAAVAIEGEAYSRAYLDRLNAGTAQPGELALILGFLDGDMLHGACRVLEKALRGEQ